MLCSATRCNLGVGAASVLICATRSTTVQQEQRRRPLCNAEHEAVPATRFAASGSASHAARTARSSWRRWMRSSCCCPPAVKEAAREQQAERAEGRGLERPLGAGAGRAVIATSSRTKFDSAFPAVSYCFFLRARLRLRLSESVPQATPTLRGLNGSPKIKGRMDSLRNAS